MTSHPRKTHPHMSESGLRRSVCARVAVALSATHTRSAEPPASSPRAIHATNCFVWRWAPPFPRHGRFRPVIHDLQCWLRRSQTWWACAQH